VTLDALANALVAGGAAVAHRGAAPDFLEGAESERDNGLSQALLGDAQAATEKLLIREHFAAAGSLERLDHVRPVWRKERG
jgi:hypothetical protein